MRVIGRSSYLAFAVIAIIAEPRVMCAGPAALPDSTAAASLDGVVTDSLNQAVAGVEIISPDRRFKATTNSVGAFKLSGIPAGGATFTVRKIGYGVGEFTLALDPGEARHQTIVLTRLNNILKPVVVAETAWHRGLREVGFYDRSAVSRGTFLTPELLAVHEGTTRTGDLLRGVNGVRISAAPTAHGMLPFSTGGYMRIGSQAVCLMNLYIDGVRVDLGSAFDRGLASKSSDHQDVVTLDDVIPAADVGAIEVYPSGVSTPQRYSGVSQGCGTILIWTKIKLNAPNRSN
ncbi:MAG: carboxypeptidase-like regulatory domain-containing protein [Gemmatimonadota bacterium]|nr:carboxypeptidase-like regulatory domain-containing protein [Gemmatimonadota bacterium]